VNGIEPSGDRGRDLDQVFSNQRPIAEMHLRAVNRVRDTRIAHLQQDAPSGTLPSFKAFQELLAFAVAFHAFVSDCFFSTNPHPIRDGTTYVVEFTCLPDTVDPRGVKRK
jgi:hypothetical protein